MLTLAQSLELQRQGRLEEAEQGYRALFEREPDNTDAVFMLGVVRLMRDDAAEAERCFERAVTAKPDIADLHLNLAVARYRAGKHELAERGYEQTLKLDPNALGAHIGLGQIMLNRGEEARAENHFRIALRAGEDGHALTGLGNIMALRGDWDAALRYLTRAVELIPNNAMAQYLLGQTFARKGLLTFARQALERCLQLAPALHEAHAWLAEVQMHEGQPRAAEAHYLHLLSVPGYELRAHAGLGDVARAENRMEDAVTHYRAAIEIDPRQPTPMRMLTVALAALGRNDEVAQTFADYLALVPDDDEVREIRADVLAAIGRNAEASAEWDVLVRRKPALATGHARAAGLKEQQGLFDAALDHALQALALDAGDVDARLVLARGQSRKGEYTAAAKTLAALDGVALSDEQARQRDRALGLCHDHDGDAAAAVRCFAHAQQSLEQALPPLAEPRPELATALAEPAGEPWSHAPVLVLGTPGSGVEQVVALLADQAQLQVLRGRAVTRDRADDFNHPRFQFYCGELDDAARESIRERYLQPLTRSGMAIDRTLVDWLPRWDAHLLAMLRRAMPGTRLLIVDADPRDALLNWLAFGWANGFACKDVETCADWLLRARAHIAHGAELDDPRRLVVRVEDLLADGAAAQELARFLDLDRLDFSAQSRRLAPGRPVTRFASGHWQAYREALAAPFARLQAN
ncbi:MAG: tetratricopeptide repeat protein [Dokdonella sp.]|uniref:tetratricopeptide repeat protein n=1 Tax=Dokdonella sp. TaxID=2291710 RepID=UPI0025C530B1|nr:tetratricopeptide repeat protein [Dokdonella sp.]MBZ0222332.1 tetratricopeptide repeat protein [Dokdonella sp.]